MLKVARTPKQFAESRRDTGFIAHEELWQLARKARPPSLERCQELLQRCMRRIERQGELDHQRKGRFTSEHEAHSMPEFRPLELEEAAELLAIDRIADPCQRDHILGLLLEYAGKLKDEIYGNRVVMFAPLYISNYCINNCTYCGYRRDNKFARKRLTQEEISREVRILEKMGHKRLALEVGEDPLNCDIDYVLESIRTIYASGDIRRINVNIAACPQADLQRLRDAEIGTYILFQETYDFDTFVRTHPRSIKGDYLYHLESFDRAMAAGIGDVGAGVLYGLSDHRFETLALLQHNRHLEQSFGVGFHTISVPRLKACKGMNIADYPHVIDDWNFRKVVAVLRLALPYVGMILSTRENSALRRELIRAGVSQVSAGSSTGVGGYYEEEQLAKPQSQLQGAESVGQFQTEDQRSPLEVVKDLASCGMLPSFCTACYRMGRTGDRFMELARSGNIKHVCQPNAIITFAEFVRDYGDDELKAQAQQILAKNIADIGNDKIRQKTREIIARLEQNESDLFF